MSIKINNKTIAGTSQTNATRFIGEIFQSALPIDDPRVGLLDGHIITIDAGYGAFIQHISNLIKLYPQLACTEEEWQQSNTSYGECGKFVVNMDNVRLPKIVSFVEGLSSLEDLGKLLEAGLPNIKGGLDYVVRSTNNTNEGTSGVFYDNGPGWWQGGNSTSSRSNIGFDASRSNSIYGKSNTVQPQAIRYPYYIVLATNTLTAINVRQELTTNNPFTLFESKYSEIEINNTSWLLSVGQWNSGDIYVSAYEALVKDYNNENKLGVKLHTESYDDYNFVINKEDKTFRLPLKSKLASGKAVAGNGMTLGLTDGTTNYGLVSGANSAGQGVGVGLNANAFDTAVGSSSLNVPGLTVKVGITTDATKSGIETSDTGLYLYYYVGETNINSNIINLGKITEELTYKFDNRNSASVVEYYRDGYSWYRIWSDGWCEQGATATVQNGNTGQDVTLLKPMSRYNVQVTMQSNAYATSGWGVSSITTTGFKIYNNNSSNARGCAWIAYGNL